MVQAVNSALRSLPVWPLYPLGLGPAAWLWYLGFTGGLGAEPINALERELGMIGLQLVIASLAVTPLRQLTGLNLLRFRRALGLLSFFYIMQHLLVWLVLDLGELSLIASDLAKRPYVIVGMLGFAAMVPLAVTSTDRAVRRLGAMRWRRLHRLAYIVPVLGVLHFAILVKGFPLEPLAYGLALAVILGLRALPGRRAKA
jgi:sulfoxide reductase heme-binding subunit YedZ